MLFDVFKTHFHKIFCHTILSNLVILKIDFSPFKIHALNSFFSVLSFYTKDSIPLYLLLNPLDFIALSLLAINSTSTNLWSSLSLSLSLCLSHSLSFSLSPSLILPLSLCLSLPISLFVCLTHSLTHKITRPDSLTPSPLFTSSQTVSLNWAVLLFFLLLLETIPASFSISFISGQKKLSKD